MTEQEQADLKLKLECLELGVKQTHLSDPLKAAKEFYEWLRPFVLLKSVAVDGNGNVIMTEV